jgi:hypothetical protein
MRTRFLSLALLIFCCAAPAIVFAQVPANDDLSVRLSLADGKSVFRAGEAITLVLSFTAHGPGYQLNSTVTKPASPIDEIMLSPTSSSFNWLDQYSGRHRYAPDHSHMGTLSANPALIKLKLNDWFRFDKPGRYTVRVKTNRVIRSDQPLKPGQALSLTTNEVSFEIKAMSQAEEDTEVRRLSALLDATKAWQEEARISEELAYLTGDAATREKVRRFLNQSGRSGNYSQNISLGLFMAKNQKLVVDLLEAELRDPNKSARYYLLQTLVGLRLYQQRANQSFQDEQLRSEAIKNGYIDELISTLPQRQGESRGATAMTILMSLPKANAAKTPAADIVLAILQQDLPKLGEFDQEYLLRVYWDQIRNAALAPAIRQILQKGASNTDLQRTALQRYFELAPDEARPFIIEQIRNPASIQSLELLRALKDETLPELDEVLLEQIRARAPVKKNFDFVQLKQKTALAARYASSAIYESLLDIYKTSNSRWEPDARASLLAYLTKHNEKEGLPLIELALTELKEGQDAMFLGDLTESYYSEEIGSLLRKRLASEDPQAVGLAAYLLSKHGSLGDQKLIAARLDRWLKEWRGREAELNPIEGSEGNAIQAMLQLNLLQALTRAKAWKLPEEENKRLQQTCLSQKCRQHFPPK